MKKKRTLLLISLCCIIMLTGCQCKHEEWSEATCTTPKTCNACGETEGTPLGHDWTDATCEKLKTCKVCNETEGELKEHTWVSATCTRPKTCTACGATDGEKDKHIWQDATCTKPKTCKFCKTTEGDALGHTPGEWVYKDPNYTAAYVSATQYCKVCNAYMDSDIRFLTKLYADGAFMFTPTEFSDRLDAIFEALPGIILHSRIAVLDDNSLGCGITSLGDVVATIMFTDNKDIMDGSQADSRDMGAIMVYFREDADASDVADSIIGIILTCDPSLEESEARSVGSKVISAYSEDDIYIKNGIRYGMTYYNGGFLFMISVLE